MKIKHMIPILVLTMIFSLFGNDRLFTVASNFIDQHDLKMILTNENSVIEFDGVMLAHAYRCEPTGFVVVSVDDRFIPVIAYSDKDNFDSKLPLAKLIMNDLNLRLKNYEKQSQSVKDKQVIKWNSLLTSGQNKPKFEQWPPVDSTSTGGWTETHWTQTAPYNKFCPMDLSNNARSYTGCPATAMSQLLFFHKNINNTRFDTSDKYYHNYTQQFWIDNASRTYDFSTFIGLNVYLTSIEEKWTEGLELNEDEIAALNWACGIATKSVFSSSGSGTFGIDQAYDAYQRFGFTGSILMNSFFSDEDIKNKMSENIKIGLPVHLATVDEAWSMGHNVVCDGYNSDGYFRLNFGWGGSSDGWYSLPEGFPYSLTVFEGIVADINLTTGIEENSLPVSTELYQNYPNPFNPVTSINFSIVSEGNVSLIVCNSMGAVVAKLIDGKMDRGYHSVPFDGSRLVSGVYYYSLKFNDQVFTHKMMILK